MTSLIRENVNLAPFTYYKIGGPARYFAQPASVDDLRELSGFLRRENARYFILGAGSNVLIDDAGFEGLVISTSKLDRTLQASGPTIEAGASVPVIQVLRHCMAQGIGGFEFLAGIPGSIGGVVCMNAGTKLGEAEKAIVEVRAFDLALNTSRSILREEMHFEYRSQRFLQPDEMIVRATLCGYASDPRKVQNDLQALLGARSKSQPVDKPSCGSVFKNPEPSRGIHAWKIISDVGLRGHRLGNAQISELHTNFIVNLGGARASDVLALINEAKNRAKNQLGITLEEEVRIIPRDGGRRLRC